MRPRGYNSYSNQLVGQVALSHLGFWPSVAYSVTLHYLHLPGGAYYVKLCFWVNLCFDVVQTLPPISKELSCPRCLDMYAARFSAGIQHWIKNNKEILLSIIVSCS